MPPADPPISGSAPIDATLPALIAALADNTNVVLEAPPGAGKTTRVPLALLEAETGDARWIAGRKIIMLEPRRIAARAAARFMAYRLGQAPGGTVGYRVRLDSRIGPDTRLEVVTEGVLLRLLQDDPSLSDVAAILFDEVHERSLDTDLGMALCLEVQGALRPDLRLLAMSATLDGEALARHLAVENRKSAPVIRSEGRAFPVETRYLSSPDSRAGPGREPSLEDRTARAVRTALSTQTGDILVFLPGAREIRRTGERLSDLSGEIIVCPLYGDLPADVQDRAIRPDPQGRRRIVLSTSLAQTSLTIDGVRIVIDGGWSRIARYDRRSGLTTLETVRVTKAEADQRRGRAGRLEPGVCYRLWEEAGQGGLADRPQPEILGADLAPLVLALANWGVRDPLTLRWIDPPPTAALEGARQILRMLDAIGEDGAITRTGKAMAAFAAHPRLAHMLLRSVPLGLLHEASLLAAMMEERDFARSGGADIAARLEHLRGNERMPGADEQLVARVRAAAKAHRDRLKAVVNESGGSTARTSGGRLWTHNPAGLLVALAFPDRIGQAIRDDDGTPTGVFRLANGRRARLDRADPLSGEPWIAIHDLDGATPVSRLYRAAALQAEALALVTAEGTVESVETAWDARERAVTAARIKRFGALVLERRSLERPDTDAIVRAMCDGIRALGLDVLPWSEDARRLRRRIAFAHRVASEGWPAMDSETLLATLEDWLGPFLNGATRPAHLARIDLAGCLAAQLDWSQRQSLDRIAPTHLTVPSGSAIALAYPEPGDDGPPILAVKLQEMFGARETPRVADGRVPVLIHLLSPARRPLAVTQDLPSFWANGYGDVRRDMRGQYPKHPWPEDPATAPATARTNRAMKKGA